MEQVQPCGSALVRTRPGASGRLLPVFGVARFFPQLLQTTAAAQIRDVEDKFLFASPTHIAATFQSGYTNVPP